MAAKIAREKLYIDPYWQTNDCETVRIYHGDSRQVLKKLPSAIVQCVMTSPPYWALRDYGEEGPKEIGSEPIPDCGSLGQSQCGQCFVCSMVDVFRQVRPVMRSDGVLWLNLGDTYNSASVNRNGLTDGLDKERMSERRKGMHGKASPIVKSIPRGSLIGIPWRVANALVRDGWVLRADLPWIKRNAMPDPAPSRPSRALEYVFMFTRSMDYYFSPHGANSKRMRNIDPWILSSSVENAESLIGIDTAVTRYKGAHYATFPPEMISPLIYSSTTRQGCCGVCRSPVKEECGCDAGDTKCIVLDPFIGSGTSVVTSLGLGCYGWGIDLNKEYLDNQAIPRIKQVLDPHLYS